MIIGIEGNVHVGKTTYINRKYISNETIIFKETEFKKELSDFDRQLYYINSEVKKKENLISKKKVVLDRTVISPYIYILYSNIFKRKEKEYFINMIIEYIKNNKIFTPELINFIIYPYDLICANQKKLYSAKKTQNLLVDYEYYINYNLFFANYINRGVKILETNNFRQVLEFSGKKIFEDIGKPQKKVRSKILLDGAPAIGKTTIGTNQKKYKYIEEFKYKKYSIDNYSNQLNSILERIDLLFEDNIMIDTSFLMGITHLFYNKKASKELKLKVIDEIISSIPLHLYTTKIIYLIAPVNVLYERKNKDNSKPRKHFEDNLQYLQQEINFYSMLEKKLGDKSNIHIIDARKNDVNKIIGEINSLSDKVLFLIDLFYSIKELVESGDI